MTKALSNYIKVDPKDFKEAIGFFEANANRRWAAIAELRKNLYHLPMHYSGTYITCFEEAVLVPDGDDFFLEGHSKGYVLLQTSDLYSARPIVPALLSVAEARANQLAQGIVEYGPVAQNERSTALLPSLPKIPFRAKPARFYCASQAKAIQEYLTNNVIGAAPALLSAVGGADVNTSESHHAQWLPYRPKNISYSPAGQTLLVELGIAHTQHLCLQAHGVDYNPFVVANELLAERYGPEICVSEGCVEESKVYIRERVKAQAQRSQVEVKLQRNAARFLSRNRKYLEKEEGKDSYETQAELRPEAAPEQGL